MNLNVLEYLGVIMIFFIVSITVICLYYAIKDAFDGWKKHHRNKCPFCGAYLYGYQHRHKGAKFDAHYCSRCGRDLNSTENTFDSDLFLREYKELLWSSNDNREMVKHERDHQRETTPDEIQN